MKLKAIIPLIFLCTALLHAGPIPPVIDSVNASYTPDAGGLWAATHVSFFYTPTFDYTLSGVYTMFGSEGVFDHNVTLNIFSDFPGGTSLMSPLSFTPFPNFWEGGTFTPINLLAGHTYVIGFAGVNGLGSNLTADAGAESVPTWFSFSSADTDWLGTFVATDKPLLEFRGVPAVSAPDGGITALMLAAGLGALLAFRRRAV